MVLVDTSVWISHLRRGSGRLQSLLDEGAVVCHPFIIGELACGQMKNREEILALLKALPQATAAEHDEAMQLIESRRLMGKGLGYVDVHLLTSSLLTGTPLWTLDRGLSTAAAKLGLSIS